jgi:hypothetical protein
MVGEEVIIQGHRCRQVPGFDRYFVSDYGVLFRISVRTQKRKKLTPGNSNGYLWYNCQDAPRKLTAGAHRLVALAWIGLPEGDRNEVHHLDSDKKNNHYSNLMWVTRQENMAAYKADNVNRPKQVRPRGRNSKLSRMVKQYHPEDGLICLHWSVQDAANSVAGNRPGVSQVCRGYIGKITGYRALTYKGFYWKYF